MLCVVTERRREAQFVRARAFECVCVFCLLRVGKGISIDGHVFVVGHSFEPFLGSILLIFGCFNRWLVSSRG